MDRFTALDDAPPGPRDGLRRRSWLREPVVWIVLLAAFTLLASQFPRSGDDWAWGSSIGIDRWNYRFRFYNGRYVGNVAALLLTRAGLVTPLVVGATIVATLGLLLDVVRMRTRTGYLVATTLLVVMPLALWREGVVWLSGFSNYALGTTAMLAFLASTRRQWDEPLRRASWWRLLAVAAVGFCGALLIEHVTLYLVLASLAAVVALRRHHGAFSPSSLAWAGALVAGAVVMFANGAYRRAFGSTADYQQIGTGTDGPLAQLTDRVSRLAVVDDLYLVVTLVALVLVLVVRRSTTWRAVRTLLVGGVAASALVLTWVLRQVLPNVRAESLLWHVSGLVAVLLLAAVVGAACWFVADPHRRGWLLLIAASVLALVAPLAVVQPIGPRNFLPTYVLMIGIALLLLQEVVDRPLPALDVVAAALTTAVLLTNLLMYAAISRAADERAELVRAAAADGATEVTLRPLPFTGAVHVPDPRGQLWQERYKAYYDLPPDLRLRVSG